MESFYRKIYGQSWLLIRSNWWLLFFGFFVALLGWSELRALSFLFGNVTNDFLSSTLDDWASIWRVASTVSLGAHNFMGFALMIVVFLLFAAGLILIISSQGALINAALNSARNRKNQTFLGNFQVGVNKFWQLLGLNILNAILAGFFVYSVVIPIFNLLAVVTDAATLFFLIFLNFFALIPLVIVVTFANRYGAALVIDKNQNFAQAFVNGWELFQINWLLTIENAMFLFLLIYAYIVVMSLVVVAPFMPFMFVGNLLSFSSWLTAIFYALGGLSSLLVLFFGTAFFGTFYNLIWANTYISVTAKKPSRSKIHRLAAKHAPLLTK